MIRGSVALPVWNSKAVAWLAMESLCRMYPPRDQWELIVFEEKHDEKLGEWFFRGYQERLRKVGCARLLFLSSEEKYPLSKKWLIIAHFAALTSKYYCLCAADNYYSPSMLMDAEKLIKKSDWVVTPRGYFYDFNFDKVLRYELFAPFGLQMIASTDKVRNLPAMEVNKGVDRWFSSYMGKNMMIDMSSDHWGGTLCTNGFNNISKERYKFFEEVVPPYYPTKKKLNDIVPNDISKRLKTLSTCLRLQ